MNKRGNSSEGLKHSSCYYRDNGVIFFGKKLYTYGDRIVWLTKIKQCVLDDDACLVLSVTQNFACCRHYAFLSNHLRKLPSFLFYVLKHTCFFEVIV